MAESGVEYLLTETGVLAEGSLAGFINGKFYNRCTNLYQVPAAVMKQALLSRYIETLEDADRSLVNDVASDSDSSIEHCQLLADNAALNGLQERFESFFQDVIAGKYGETRQHIGPSTCMSTSSIECIKICSAPYGRMMLIDTSRSSQR